ncbi:regulator of G-protein signaling 22 [Lycodopsis pacificus]
MQENSLASDDLLAQYFNDFLTLPSFPETPLLYNQETGLFEVVDGAAEFASRRIRSGLHRSRSQLLTGDPAALARTPPVDNHYTIRCLDREQGIQWIVKERLPFFLQSDCYNEYRLSKLLFQKNTIFCIQRRKGSSGRPTCSASQLRFPSQSDEETNKTLKGLPCSHSQDNSSAKQGSLGTHNVTCLRSGLKEHINTKGSESSRCFSSCSEPENPCHFSSSSSPSNLECEKPQSPQTEWRLSFTQPSAGNSEEQQESSRQNDEPPELQLEYLAAKVVKQVLNNALYVMDGQSRANLSDSFSKSGDQTNCTSEDGSCDGKVLSADEGTERLEGKKEKVQEGERYLVLMRRRYLLSSSQSRLNVELLSRLGMTTSTCWTEEKLRSVLPFLIEPLLYYWVPRFWTSQWVHEDHGSMALCSDTCLLQCPHAVHTQFCASRSQILGSGRMKKILQVLSAESYAGLYFTHFCEQSGNQLWENAVNLWTDLQHYYELFVQDGLDRYRVQREAQLFYHTYLSSSARRSIGVSEEIRREVYDQMMPAFEELFDKVEEHTLSILLEPWTLLVSRDKESFQKVCVQEEVRCIDSQEYRELQSLYKESERRLKQVSRRPQCSSTLFPSPISPSTPFSKGPRASWSRVPPKYQGYRLGSLFLHRHETGHFMSFLQNLDASIHLTCWLDLEQYRRTPHKDTAVRREKWSHIATRYLTRTYFFGSDSSATTEQQNDILLLAGGLEHLKLECPSNPVVREIQEVIRSHIEERWLPLFLSTAEFTERLKHQPEPQAADRLSQHVYRRRRARREAWKAKDLRMSSSKDSLLFRQILLNPATCTQFQHFVSLKGDFLETDVLFWLEVQRYKDLCHSHSDEATVQQKVSTIIHCFIDSSVPPALQIDIPPEQAQQVLEKRHELGPYIFREAQMSVFSALLKFWPEFQELSSSVQEGQLLPLLQEKRVKHRARVRRQRRKEEEEEEKRAQEELERPESSLGEEEEEEEDDAEEGQAGRSVKKQSRAQSRELLSPTQQLSWSYSKYLAALKREKGASFSTASGN